jgi:hypothetical protein
VEPIFAALKQHAELQQQILQQQIMMPLGERITVPSK